MATGGIAQDEIIQVKRDPWTDNFFRPLLIIIMIMCLNIAIVNLVRLVNPSWSGRYFLVAMLLTTVEGIYSYRIAHHYSARGVSMLRYRLAEAVVLILLIKLLSFLDKPLALVGAELQAMWAHPGAFFSTEFYMSATLALIAWLAATQTIADFEDLYDPYTDNTFVLHSLASRFYWGGGLLVVISGITQWAATSGLRSLANFQRPSLGGIVLNVLVYFMLGLVLISQVNLTRLTVRWRVQKIATAPDLVKKWAIYGLTFLALVTVIAFLLPTSYTLGFLTIAGLVIQYIIATIVFMFQLLVVLMTLPLTWLFNRLGVEAPDMGGVAPLPPPPLLPEAAPGGMPPWLEILRSLIFWLVALAVIGYFIKTYLDDHPGLLKQLKRFRPIGLALSLFGQLWRYLRHLIEVGLETIPTDHPTLTKTESQKAKVRPLNWLRLRHLPARERILYYYLNILDRAEKVGPRRREHQTPYEYEPNLQQSTPTAEAEVHDVTDIFVHARYSQDEFDEQDAELVKQEWQQIKKAMRRGKSETSKE